MSLRGAVPAKHFCIGCWAQPGASGIVCPSAAEATLLVCPRCQSGSRRHLARGLSPISGRYTSYQKCVLEAKRLPTIGVQLRAGGLRLGHMGNLANKVLGCKLQAFILSVMLLKRDRATMGT